MDRVSVSLLVWTKSIELEQVTRVLQREPDSVTIKGPDRHPPRPVPPMNGWILACEEEGVPDLERLLNVMLQKTKHLVLPVRALRAMGPLLEIELAILVRPFSDTIPFVFDAELVRVLAEMGESLDFECFPPVERDVNGN